MIDAFRSAILAKADIRFRDIIRFAGQFVPEEYYGPLWLTCKVPCLSYPKIL